MANMFSKGYNVGNNSNLMILHSFYDSSQFFKMKWEGHGLVHFHTYVEKLVPRKCLNRNNYVLCDLLMRLFWMGM